MIPSIFHKFSPWLPEPAGRFIACKCSRGGLIQSKQAKLVNVRGECDTIAVFFSALGQREEGVGGQHVPDGMTAVLRVRPAKFESVVTDSPSNLVVAAVPSSERRHRVPKVDEVFEAV